MTVTFSILYDTVLVNRWNKHGIASLILQNIISELKGSIHIKKKHRNVEVEGILRPCLLVIIIKI
jgi:hypothetical protein